jgi:aminopeptidase N
MYEVLLGLEGFRSGMDLYFERHDGEAVTCDDFRSAMADANGIADGLAQFEEWYLQSGTPTVASDLSYDANSGKATLNLKQSCPPVRFKSALCHPLPHSISDNVSAAKQLRLLASRRSGRT